MTPFLQLRYWLRQAPATSKAYAFFSVAVVLALVAWIAVPAGSNPADASSGSSFTVTSTAPNPTAGPSTAAPATEAPASTTPGAPAPTNGATPATGAPNISGPLPVGPAPTQATGTTGAPTQHATSPKPSKHAAASASATSNSQTCTDNLAPIRIGVVLIEIGQGSASLNNTFGVPPSSEQRADYNAMFDTVNKAGGVLCHPLVGDFQTYNELNPSSSTTACNSFVQDKVFAVMGGFLPTASDACLLTHHLPTFETTPLPRDDLQKYFPYLWSASGIVERIFVNFAHAMSQAGYFSSAKKFTKVGIVYRDCIPNEFQHLVSSLTSITGIGSTQMTSFNLGCPSALASPTAISQAVAQFRTQGVSTVIPMDDGTDIQAFTNDANLQGFHPQYLIADTQEVAVVSGKNFAPNQSNFNGALAVTAQSYGSLGSQTTETAATVACDQVMTAHGLPAVRVSADEFAGAVCSFVSVLVAAMEHDPDGSQASLVNGIHGAGHIDLAEPEGPNDYSKTLTTTGGSQWRTVVYTNTCACWKVQQDFQPSFADAG